MEADADTKQCTLCREVKPLSEFRWRQSKVRYHGWCRDCERLQAVRPSNEGRVKTCTWCGGTKPLKEFSWLVKQRRHNDLCRDCRIRYVHQLIRALRQGGQAKRRRDPETLATPPWLNDHHRLQISTMEWKAAQLTKTTGIIHRVCHIIPLDGKGVCGLHVPWNLQIATAAEIASRSTGWTPEDSLAPTPYNVHAIATL